MTGYTDAPAPTRCIVRIMDMPDDPATIAAYDQAHRVGHTPPAVLDMQRRHGIADLEIFRADNRLAMLMHVTEAFDPAGIEAESASNPVLIAWHRQMGVMQRPPFADGRNWPEAVRVFRQSDHNVLNEE